MWPEWVGYSLLQIPPVKRKNKKMYRPQKKLPKSFKPLESQTGGEYRSRTGDLLHAMQAL